MRDQPPVRSAPIRNWQGRAAVGPGWALFSGHAGDNAPHAHHALQIAIARGDPCVVELDGGRRIASRGLLIAADVRHRLLSTAQSVTLIYVERESVWARGLASGCDDGVRVLSTNERVRIERTLDRLRHEPGEQVFAGLMAALGARPDSARAPDRHDSAARVARLVAALSRRPGLDLAAVGLAAEAHLSRSRFAHLFRRQTGMALRPYLRWLRLNRAMLAAARGASLTEAAHQAGFADAAHLSRIVRRHFGIAPSSIVAAFARN